MAFPLPVVFGAGEPTTLRGCGVRVSSAIGYPRGVQLSDVGVAEGLAANLGAPPNGADFDGDAFGVVCRSGDGEAGDSGRRNGELRGEPYPNGDGLYGVGIDFHSCQLRIGGVVPRAVGPHHDDVFVMLGVTGSLIFSRGARCNRVWSFERGGNGSPE